MRLLQQCDRELQQRISEFSANANYTIQQFKGLGEMMPQQLVVGYYYEPPNPNLQASRD